MYTDPVIKKYLDLFKANTGGAIKTFIQGEPVKIATSNLPALMISKRETRVASFSNADDEYGIGMSITVITDIRSDLSTTEADDKIVKGVAHLYDLIEGRNDDYTLKNTSVLHILRSNIEVDTANNLRTELGSITRVDYGFTLKERDPSTWSIEARIDFVANFIQVR